MTFRRQILLERIIAIREVAFALRGAAIRRFPVRMSGATVTTSHDAVRLERVHLPLGPCQRRLSAAAQYERVVRKRVGQVVHVTTFGREGVVDRFTLVVVDGGRRQRRRRPVIIVGRQFADAVTDGATNGSVFRRVPDARSLTEHPAVAAAAAATSQ